MAYLTSNGKFGKLPPDYTIWKASQLLGVPPWVVEARDDYWPEKALFYAGCDAEAAAINGKEPARMNKNKKR